MDEKKIITVENLRQFKDLYDVEIADGLLAKENTANKVTTITEESTDGQYPSAKAVRTYVEDNTIDETVDNLVNYTLKTETGSSIDLSINSSTYVMTLNLKDINGNTISTDSIDLPLETMVVSADYDSETKEIVLTLQSGATTRFSVADLVSGLQTEITTTNKLSSDLVDDTNATNKFVTNVEKTTWNGKQDLLTAGDNITIENNVISGGAQQVYVIEADYPSAWGTDSFTLDERDTETVNKFIEALLRGEKPLIVLRSAVTSLKTQKFRNTMFGYYYYTSGATSVSITFYNLLGSSYIYNGDIHYIRIRYLHIQNMATPSTQTNFIVTAENPNENLGFLTIKNTDIFTPTAGSYNPATAKYAEEQAEAVKVQYSTMPTASADNLGKIVQYTGATDSTYIQGHFYIVVSDGEDPATYSWEEISLGGETVYLTYGDTSSEAMSSLSNIITEALNTGIATPIILYVKDNITRTKNGNTIGFFGGYYPLILDNLGNIKGYSRTTFRTSLYKGYLFSGNVNDFNTISVEVRGDYDETDPNNKIFTVTSISYEPSNSMMVPDSAVAVYRYNGGISNDKVLSVNNVLQYTPTSDYNPSTKKYTDDTSLATVVADKLTGIAAPTTATVGYVGQQYTDTTNNDQYVCTAVDTEIPEYTWVQVNGGGGSKEYVIYSTDTTETQIAILNEAYQKYLQDYNNPTIYWINTNDAFHDKTRYIATSFYVNGNKLNIVFYSINAFNGMVNRYQMPRFSCIELTCTLSNDVIITINKAYEWIYGDMLTKYGTGNSSQQNYYSALGVNNTTSYTPTSDYNPATKKYVDDSVAVIDSKLSTVYRYKGTVATYSALPSTDQTVGDVYNVEAADSTHGIKAGDNVAWTGTAWDVLAGTIDLSNYATTQELNELADVVENTATDADIDSLFS